MSCIKNQTKESFSSSDQDSLSASDCPLITEKQRRRGFRRYCTKKMASNNSDRSVDAEDRTILPPPSPAATAAAIDTASSLTPKKSRVSTARSADSGNETVSFLKSSRSPQSKKSRRAGRIRGLFGSRKSNPWKTAEAATSAGLYEQLLLETSSELFQLEKKDIELHYRIENSFLNAFFS